MITLDLADAQGLRWAQDMVARYHYLHTPVDPRCSPVCYLAHYHYQWGMGAAAGPRCVGILIFGRPESTQCFQGGLTYGSAADVASGRAEWERWEILNLARVWVAPCAQAGGSLHNPESGLPGYTDRRGVWRSTLASDLIGQALARVGYDYLMRRPPVDVAEPYELRRLLSYCDTRVHRGTIYRASGWSLARENESGVQTWCSPPLPHLTEEQDAAVRRASQRDRRARGLRQRREVQAAEQARFL